MLVKICGITNVEDALAAESAGADLIGIIFADRSPRRLDVKRGKEICTALGGERVVGVFQNQSLDEIESMRTACGFKYAQLHGEEELALTSQIPNCIKALTINSPSDLDLANAYSQSSMMLLLDKPKSSSSDPNWLIHICEWLRDFRIPVDFLLAGGLTIDNVAVTLSRIGSAKQPHFAGIDVASGVESAPGIKDKALLREFILEAKSNAVAR